AKNAPYRMTNVAAAKAVKIPHRRLSVFQNTSAYPSDLNQSRSTQYENAVRLPNTMQATTAMTIRKRRRRRGGFVCGLSMKSGNAPPRFASTPVVRVTGKRILQCLKKDGYRTAVDPWSRHLNTAI